MLVKGATGMGLLNHFFRSVAFPIFTIDKSHVIYWMSLSYLADVPTAHVWGTLAQIESASKEFNRYIFRKYKVAYRKNWRTKLY